MRYDDLDEEYDYGCREQEPHTDAAVVEIIFGLLLTVAIIAGFGGKPPDGFVESMWRMMNGSW